MRATRRPTRDPRLGYSSQLSLAEPSMTSTRIAGAVVVALAAALAACGQKNDSAPAAGAKGPGAGGGPPPAEVGVITAQARPVGIVTELPGRLEASRVAQVRARAAGILQRRLFTEGSDVKAGQLLFKIDPASLQSVVASAQATLMRAQAALTQATAQADRYKPLLEANAISKQDYVNAVAAQKTAEADVAAARANLQSGQINLGYATVTAPISGRIGRALVTEGALVGQGEATPLAVIQQINPMYVNFTQSATDVLALRRAVASGRFRHADGGDAASVQIVLEDGSAYGQRGKLLFSDLSVDPTSGQITLRAEVANPRGILLPGMYVRVRLEQAETPTGIVVPQQAVQRGSTGDSVMIVGVDSTVTPRPVKVGPAQGGDWIILDGVKPGELVMVDGFQKLRGTSPVKPVPWQPAASAAASPASNGRVASSAPAAAASR